MHLSDMGSAAGSVLPGKALYRDNARALAPPPPAARARTGRESRGETLAALAAWSRACPFSASGKFALPFLRPATFETLPVLEEQPAGRLLAFERLDEAGLKGRTAIERAAIGRRREDALSGIVTLRQRIVTARAETPADATVQLRRLVVMAEEAPRPHALLASPDVRRLVAPVLDVVERAVEADQGAALDIALRCLHEGNFRNVTCRMDSACQLR